MENNNLYNKFSNPMLPEDVIHLITNRFCKYKNEYVRNLQKVGIIVDKIIDSKNNIVDRFGYFKIGDPITNVLNGNSLTQEEVYWTPQTFTIRDGYNKRTHGFASFINSIVVDLDYYKIPAFKYFKFSDVFDLVWDKLGNKLYPNLICDTGNGMHLYWLIDPEIKYWFSEKQFTIVSNEFIKILKYFNSDEKCNEVTRIYRFPCSINKRTGKTVKFYLLDEEPYDLFELADLLGVRLKKNFEKKKKVVKASTKATVQNSVINKRIKPTGRNYLQTKNVQLDDLKKIAAHRKLGLKAGRYHLLYLACRAAYDSPDVFNILNEINSMFLVPYDDKKINSIVKDMNKYAVKCKRNNHKAPFMIKVHEVNGNAVVYGKGESKDIYLEVTQQEMTALGLDYFIVGHYKANRSQSIKSNYLQNQMLCRRNEEGMTSRQEILELKYDLLQIHYDVKKSIGLRNIKEIFPDLSKNTLVSYLKVIRERESLNKRISKIFRKWRKTRGY